MSRMSRRSRRFRALRDINFPQGSVNFREHPPSKRPSRQNGQGPSFKQHKRPYGSPLSQRGHARFRARHTSCFGRAPVSDRAAPPIERFVQAQAPWRSAGKHATPPSIGDALD